MEPSPIPGVLRMWIAAPDPTLDSPRPGYRAVNGGGIVFASTAAWDRPSDFDYEIERCKARCKRAAKEKGYTHVRVVRFG
jgi:hypothetical protein